MQIMFRLYEFSAIHCTLQVRLVSSNIFLVARSQWTNFFFDKYSIPDAICLAKIISSVQRSSCKKLSDLNILFKSKLCIWPVLGNHISRFSLPNQISIHISICHVFKNNSLKYKVEHDHVIMHVLYGRVRKERGQGEDVIARFHPLSLLMKTFVVAMFKTCI